MGSDDLEGKLADRETSLTNPLQTLRTGSIHVMMKPQDRLEFVSHLLVTKTYTDWG